VGLEIGFVSRLWLAMALKCINSWLFSHVKCSISLPASCVLSTVLRSYTSALQRAANEASTIGWHCTLYVVIGIITQTLRVIGMSQANIDKLERVQNILARVVVGAPWTSSSLNIRRDLHWLPVGHRITYKLSHHLENTSACLPV